MVVFDRIKHRNDACWTAMLHGLAENGYDKEVLEYFDEMERTTTFPPNELILTDLLFACSRSGLVDKGLHYFNSLKTVNETHFNCVVDMLSQSGWLSEAEIFMENMPCEPDLNTWRTLLNGCKVHNNEELAARAAEKLKELAENKPGGEEIE